MSGRRDRMTRHGASPGASMLATPSRTLRANGFGMMRTSVFRLPPILLLLAAALMALSVLFAPGAQPAAAQAQAQTTAPGAPGGLVLALGNAKLVAGWNPPEDNGGAEITAYTVQYKTTAADDTAGVVADPHTGWVDAGHSGTGTDTEITGLTNGVGYDVRVRASNSEGDGQWSDTASAAPHEDVIWSAILTVDVDNDYGDGAGTFGCVIDVLNSSMDECPEALTEDEFAFGLDAYGWTQFSRYVSNDGTPARSTKVGLSALVPDDSNLRKGKLQVGGGLVSLDDTSRVQWFIPDPDTYPNMQWIHAGFLLLDDTSMGLKWSEGQRVPLSLQARLPEAILSGPTISSVAVTSATGEGFTAYGIDDVIEVTVNFSESVTVTGAPQLQLSVGTDSKTATYASSVGSSVVFNYTVAEGDSDTNGVSIQANKLSLNGGSIKDASNNDADLSHEALPDQENHKVDGIRPSLSNVYYLYGSRAGSNGFFTAGDSFDVVAQFTETVYVSESGQVAITLKVGGVEKTVEVADSWYVDRNEERFEYRVQEGDLALDGVSVAANAVTLDGGATVRDAAGNDAVLTHPAVTNSLLQVDAVLPAISSITITSDPGEDDTYAVGGKIEVRVTFSENVDVPRVNRSDMPGDRWPQLELNIGGRQRRPDTRALPALT